MAVDGKEDLRIQRTKEAIRTTFEDMICEMDYEQISIKRFGLCVCTGRDVWNCIL